MLALVLALVVQLAGSPGTAAQGATTVTDVVGRTVTVKTPVERVLVIFAFSMMRGVIAETMVLLGIALVFLFQALLALLQYIASEQALQQVVFWSLGSLSKASCRSWASASSWP